MNNLVVAALYKFVRLVDYRDLQPLLLKFCQAQDIKGTLLLAEEGINGTVCGSPEAIERLLDWLRADPRLADIEHKESVHREQPFYRMKVKLKKEIVTLGVPGTDPQKSVGTYVEPRDWNRLVRDPDVHLIDTRNHYEVAIGKFEGAIDPETTNFREFPEYVEKHLDANKHKKVAMYCTGGIRCEKATSYLLEQGFSEVYHLRGGILKYLEEVPKEESLWQGECFVFDNRVAVDHDLQAGSYDMCHGCRMPITDADKASGHYQRGVCCPKCFDSLSDDQKQRFAERQKQIDLARARGEAHIGKSDPERMVS